MDEKVIINCWCDKVLKAFPHISEYVLLLNLWIVNIDLNDRTNTVDINYNLQWKYLEQSCNFYGLNELYTDMPLDLLVKNGITVFVECDAYYLPYHQYYLSRNSDGEHIITIDSYDESQGYHVYDDLPEFDGYIEKKYIDILIQNGGKIYWYDLNKKKIPKIDEYKFMLDNLSDSPISNKSFFNKLARSDIDNIAKMSIIVGLKNYSAFYNSLYRIVLKLANDFENKCVDNFCVIVKAYIDDWQLVTSMAHKGVMSKKDVFYDRVKIRIENLLQNEINVNKVIRCLKLLILPRIVNEYNKSF